jgi:hypothetical protein
LTITATRIQDSTQRTPVLYLAFELGWNEWKLAFATGPAENVVDSSSIEVNRRGRRCKTDRVDAGKLLSMLIRWHQGEKKVWSVVQVPSVADEDRRQLHRDLLELNTNRIKGLLASYGLAVAKIDEDLKCPRERSWLTGKAS